MSRGTFAVAWHYGSCRRHRLTQNSTFQIRRFRAREIANFATLLKIFALIAILWIDDFAIIAII